MQKRPRLSEEEYELVQRFRQCGEESRDAISWAAEVAARVDARARRDPAYARGVREFKALVRDPGAEPLGLEDRRH